MNKLILTLTCIILLTTSAWADDLGCFEPNETVYATIQFNGVSGESAATSVSARVFDPDDTTTPTATPTMSAVDGTNALGLYRGSFSVGAPLAGTWTIRYKGTVDSVVKAATDTFYVVDTAGDCASRTGVVVTGLTPGNLDVAVSTLSTSSALATAQADLDVITGTSGVLVDPVATGTENGAAASTSSKVYTTLAATRTHIGKCLEVTVNTGANTETRRIWSQGTDGSGDYFQLAPSLSVAPDDIGALKVYRDGC